MSKRFVLGDIHGEYDKLLEVLKKSGFDYEKDTLYQIGDIVDRGPEPFKCMDELMKINNLILIRGNHDDCFLSFTFRKDGYHTLGLNNSNGAGVTVQKWNKLTLEEKGKYREFLHKQFDYYDTADNILFVHGGFDRHKHIYDQEPQTFYWDRELIQEAVIDPEVVLPNVNGFEKIFIGHTPTLYWNKTEPMRMGNIWNIDTGAGKTGPLTIMDIDTEEYWQSEHNFLPE